MWDIRYVVVSMLFALWWTPTAVALELDISSTDSIKSTSKTLAKDLLSFYKGGEPGQTPGILLKPYYWWQAGAMWGTLIEYWASTGDTQYNELITSSLLFQVGNDRNFMPSNASNEEGNDDQAFWALSAMTAAELNFPDPPPSQPQWLALVQAVFASQIKRWDMESCAGGLRWQILFTNPGWNYKNTISNAALFQMAARLARYTGNDTYTVWANKAWDWMASTPNLTPDFTVNDGSDIKLNCTDANGIQWTYNYGALIMGAANMYDYTSGAARELWKARLEGLWKQSVRHFFPSIEPLTQAPLNPNIMVEISCEWAKACNPDQTSFKAYYSRWLAATIQLAPFLREEIMPKLQASAKGAALQCSGGDTGTKCGRHWNSGTWDGFTGVGEQLSALAVVQATLIDKARKPVTWHTGGTSKGDPNAGSGKPEKRLGEITSASRAAAGILTALSLMSIVGGAWWMTDDGMTLRAAKSIREQLSTHHLGK